MFVRHALALLEEMDREGDNVDIVEQQPSHEEVRDPAPGPDFLAGAREATEHFGKGKTYREQDVGELHLLRLLVERAGLIRSARLCV